MTKRRKGIGFIRKTSTATSLIPNKLMNGAIRGASAVGANIGSNHLSRLVPKIPAKAHGPAMFLLGIAGECFIENEMARSAAEGITTAGAIKMAEEWTPDTIKAKIGMSGLGNKVVDGTPSWQELAEQSEEEALALEEFTNSSELVDYSNEAELQSQLESLKVQL